MPNFQESGGCKKKKKKKKKFRFVRIPVKLGLGLLESICSSSEFSYSLLFCYDCSLNYQIC